MVGLPITSRPGRIAMLAEQRHQYILSELGRSGALSVAVVENAENDEGLTLIRFIRRQDNSPDRRIPIVAASPIPLAPIGLIGVGVSGWSVVNIGKSRARGTA